MMEKERDEKSIKELLMGKEESFKHSRVLAYVSWITVFGIIWLTLFNIIPLSGVVWGFWGFSLFIGVVSAAVR